MSTFIRTFIFFALSLSIVTPVHAGVESELRKMTGYTIVYSGYIREHIEKSYGEKFLQLDNGWIFKLDCMMLMPLNMTDVIVFGKSLPDEVLKRVPNLPQYMQYQFKLLIDQEVCDATLTK